MLSGVAQGSVLGPLLFILFINDLPDCLTSDKCKLYIFADDVKCLSEITSYNDCAILQSNLQRIYEWSVTWQLPLSITKCNVISFSVPGNKMSFNYAIGNQSLAVVDEISDLGVLLSCDLSFAKHINRTCSKARLRANMILKCFVSRDKSILYKAFVSYVRPILEYCSNVWSFFFLISNSFFFFKQKLNTIK